MPITKKKRCTAGRAERAKVQQLVTTYGEAGAAKLLGLGRSAVLRLYAGLEVQVGTLAVLREYMAK